MEIRQDYRVGRVAGSSGLSEGRERDASARQCIIRRTYAVDNAAAGLGSRVNSAQFIFTGVHGRYSLSTDCS